MTDPRARALSRLFLLTVVVALFAALACRPAWSPDGKKLLMPFQFDKGHCGLACYDRGSGVGELLMTLPCEKGAIAAQWAPDGSGVLVVSAGSKGVKNLTVTMLQLPDRAIKVLEVATQQDAISSLVVPPVCIGKHLYLGAGDIVRLDLASGEQQRSAVRFKEVVVAARGAGICYFGSRSVEGRDAWEYGTLDPATLQTTAVIGPEDAPGWQLQPLPAFNRDLSRMAVPAKSAGDRAQMAILVFSGKRLEATLLLGDAMQVEVGSLEWARDDVTVLASVTRKDDAGARTCALEELLISGSVGRSTKVFEIASPPDNMAGLALPIAMSPDGRTVALGNGMTPDLPESLRGIYLVDMTDKQRKVTRLPLPLAELKMMGSDVMLELGGAWADGYALAHPERLLSVSGGGSGTGLAGLIHGTLDLAMTARPPSAQELAQAQANGCTLTGQCVAYDAIAVCVHADNPVASLTLQQLGALFGGGDAPRWSELGVQLPGGDAKVERVLSRALRSSFVYRTILLARGREGTGTLIVQPAAALRELAEKPAALVLMPLADVGEPMRAVAVVGSDGKAVLGGAASVADGSYPLARPLYVYARKDPAAKVAAFLTWLDSAAGRACTRRGGFFVLP